MASLSKTYSHEKLFGQVYTPNFVVCKILDDIGFNSADSLGKKILDPACGDGQFLIEIVRRIILYSNGSDLQENLECVHGWDIDEIAVKKCIKNLNDLVTDLDVSIDWHIVCTDSIQKHQKGDLFSQSSKCPKFDYIVGNPPYIRIQHLDLEQRQYIQQHYDFCKNGSTDIYIAFYELCLNLLHDDGICGLITPNTFLFTETAKMLRHYFANHRGLIQITNYGEIQLFDNATTYSAITIFDRRKHANFLYQKANSATAFEERKIDFDELDEPFWQLSIDQIAKISGKKLKDICNIHVGITTLCDSAYIFTIEELDENYVWANTKLQGQVKMEKSILKPIVKGSKLKYSEQEISEYVLFPYKKICGKHSIIPEQELSEKYPFAYRYLLSVKQELDKRDNGTLNPVAWYAFGRSQGLDTSFGEKIIFSPMNNKPNFIYYGNQDCTFYSGYCIKTNYNPKNLLSQLNSERMARFVSMSSRDFRGGWKAYNKKTIENFEVQI